MSISEDTHSGSPTAPAASRGEPASTQIDAHDLLVRLGLAQYSAMAGDSGQVAGLVEAQRIVREMAGIDSVHR